MRHSVACALLLVSTASYAQVVDRVSVEPRDESLLIRFEYSSDVSAALPNTTLTYQRFNDQRNAVGPRSTKPPESSSRPTEIAYKLSLSDLDGAAEVEFRSEITDPSGSPIASPAVRIRLDEAKKTAKQTSKASQLAREIQELKQENEKLRAFLSGPNCAVASGVKFDEQVGVFDDRAWLRFTTPSVGKVRASLSGADGTYLEKDSFGTEHDILFEDLRPETVYEAQAWVLTAMDEEKEGTRITKTNHDVNMALIRTGGKVGDVQIAASTAVSQNDSIIVTVPLSEPTAYEIDLYQEVTGQDGVVTYRHAGATKERIQFREPFGLPLNLRPSGTSSTTRFAALRDNTRYKVVVNACNRYGKSVTDTKYVMTGEPPVVFDFAEEPVELSISPIGYLISWNATDEPDPETAAGEQPSAGMKVWFRDPNAPLTTVRAGRNGKQLTAAFDMASIRSLVEKSRGEQTPPVLTVFMKKGTRVVARNVRLSFAMPETTQVDALALSPEQKQQLKDAIKHAMKKRSITIDWKKLGKDGLTILMNAIL